MLQISGITPRSYPRITGQRCHNVVKRRGRALKTTRQIRRAICFWLPSTDEHICLCTYNSNAATIEVDCRFAYAFDTGRYLKSDIKSTYIYSVRYCKVVMTEY